MAEEDQVSLLAYHKIATSPGESLRLGLLQPMTIDGHLEAVCIEHGKPRKKRRDADSGKAAFVRRARKAGSKQKDIDWWTSDG